MRSLLCVFILFSPILVSANQPLLIYKNNDGVKKYKDQKFLDSYETFLTLTAEDPFDPLLQFNVGSALFANGEEEKSASLNKQILQQIDTLLAQTQDKERQQALLKVKFAALYNLGVYYQAAKDPENALLYYQQGLELVPQSKEIKTNIELMFQNGQNGKGKSDQKDKNQQQGEGDQNQEQDQQDQEGQKEQQKQQEQQSKPQEPKKEFDQKQMSMEDLERIMEELKRQEQSIRAKMNKKGGKHDPKDKQW